MNTPRVFVSYSHDSDAHKDWTLAFATKLISNGVETILDQWDLKPGMDLIKFMENGLSNSDKTIIICTVKYTERSDKGLGGVGYETIIAQSEFFKDLATEKFIPIKRELAAPVPKFLGTRLYIDFTDDQLFDKSFEELIRILHNTPRNTKPVLGSNPYGKSDIEAKKITSNHGASFVLKAWMESGGDLQKVEPYVFEWLSNHNNEPDAAYILYQWMNSGGDLNRVEPYIFEWLAMHGHEQNANFIITSWLKAGGDVNKVEPYLNEWLKRFSRIR